VSDPEGGKIAAKPDSRTLRRDGSYNIERRGIPRRRFTYDAYHHLLSLPWSGLIVYIAVAYVAVNALFAGMYLALGNAIENARPGSFEDAFFFSVQTMATIGYGKLVPSGFAGNLLVTVESLLGMVTVAVLTGLLFAKFSRPTSRVVFSKVATVTMHEGVPTLMFRVANERDSIIVEARMRVVLIRGERSAEGATMRRFHDLVLSRSETPVFPLSWTVSHALDQKSPLYGRPADTWQAEDVEIICALAGTEESIAQTIHARFSYASSDVRWGYRFVDMISLGEDGRRIIDYTRFHEVIEETPAVKG
jgi:inward rectifier potassium channel